MNLNGKTALVTGSTSGIGLGIAMSLARQGATLVLNGFGDVDGAKARVAALGVPVHYHGADMSKPAEIEAMMAFAAEAAGGVDILVNNAGIQHVANVEDFPVERWDAIIAINLSSAFHTSRLVIPAMRARNWGRIVNIASAHGLVASAAKSAYVAAKHGVVGLTKVSALELATTGVTVNAICPGWVLTPLVQKQIDARAARVGPRSMRQAPAGDPAAPALALAAPAAAPEGGTTHVSVVDAVGRAVALTSSIEAMFGARLMSDGGTGLPGGFLLNNQLTDFSFVPSDAQGRPLANRVEGGKRPRSSMSPTLVFDRRDGRLAMVTGSALGAHIIPAVARTLVGTLRWQLHPQDAVALPQVSALNGPTLLEAGRFEPAVVQALRERGHEVVEQPLPTGLSALAWRDGAWHGAADPRREGAVRGR